MTQRSLVQAFLALAFRRGWEHARQVAVAAVTMLVIFAAHEPYLTQRASLGVLLPPVVGLMLTSQGWILVSGAVTLLGLAARSHFQTPLLEPTNLLLIILSVSGLVLARRSVDMAMARMQAQTLEADEARRQSEAAARDAIAERDRATKLEAALGQTQRLESVGRLAGGIAHDFNNLLTVIGASTSMAERTLAAGGSPMAELHEVQVAVARASELTKQLLASARKQVLVRRDVELNALVANVDQLLRRVLGERTVLVAQLDPGPLRVLADAAQLEQVLVNLVLNARDAISEGGRIVLATGRETRQASAPERDGLNGGAYAYLEVTDDGGGMTQEVQQRLFEPFFTTKAPGRGTGLGLATSFGIVRQHDGLIQVQSQVGRGTSMRVLLPLAVAQDASAPPSGVSPVGRTQRRVLVVEDEPQVRSVAARALTSAGFEVLQAANGALGLAILKNQTKPVDVIVTDVMMPELDGPSLARAARTLEPRLGLVFMSGFPQAMHDVRVSDFEGAVYLTKPFAPSELVDGVRTCLAQRASSSAEDKAAVAG